jgi:peroxiredoxin
MQLQKSMPCIPAYKASVHKISEFCYRSGITFYIVIHSLLTSETSKCLIKQTKMKRITDAAKTLLILSVFVLASCTQSGETDRMQTISDADKAPAFEVTTINGSTISLEQSLNEGKPVVIYFTASWCPTCARNWPAISEVYPEYEDKLTLVAISIDPTDTAEVIRKLSEERGFKFPSTAGKPQIMIDFGVSGQATTVGVDRDGYIAFKKAGQALTADEYRELFAGLLN